MRDVNVTLSSGEVLCGPLWTWRPSEGWFSLAGEDTRQIFLRDVRQAVNPQTWLPGGTVGSVDLLERARKEGWNGQ